MNVRALVAGHDDLPAFRAGFLVLSFLFAALLEFGAFALLIGAHVAMDIVKYREIHKLRWSMTIRGIIRENIADATFLLFGLAVLILSNPALYEGSFGVVFGPRRIILTAFAIVLSKFLILTHFLHVLMHPVRHNLATGYAKRKAWLMSEQMYASIFLLLLLFFLLAPHFFAVHSAVFRGVLIEQLVPWRS